MSERAAGLVLTKHEAAGNDFLVLAGRRSVPVDGRLARALCDRHRGVGADGLVLAEPAAPGTGAEVAMVLWNADGSEAEMSGNGIRCLAQAVVDAGMAPPPTVRVATAAGLRTVTYHPGSRPGTGTGTVDMGPVRLGAERPSGGLVRRAVTADVGNPHLVVLVDADLSTVDLPALVAELGAAAVNLEVVVRRAGPGDRLALRVWERGVGETLACGTGTCAAAAAARAWGLVGDRVEVANPGGILEVRLGARAEDPVLLGGPVRRVATVEVDPEGLDPAAEAAAGEAPAVAIVGR